MASFLDLLRIGVYTDSMRANIYIRKSDEQKWAELENKSQFISDALNRQQVSPSPPVKIVYKEKSHWWNAVSGSPSPEDKDYEKD